MSEILVPIEQKQVTFYEDKITAVRVKIGQDDLVYIPIRPLCDLLGVAWSSQRLRINRDPVLSEQLIPCVIVTITQGQPKQRRDMLCLPLDFINGWLFGINASRVKEHIRERLIRYQKECYRVLAEAFQEGRLTADPTFDELLKTDTESVQAYKMIQGMLKLARQQILIESRLNQHEEQMANYENRLEQVEAQLGNSDRYVSNEQASQISQAVKAVAIVMREQTNRNEFGAVYGELYRKFGVTSYKQIPANKFYETMKWLSDWYQSLTDEDVPF